MRNKHRIAMLIVLSLLAACGQKGELVRPEPKPAETSAQ